VLAITDRHVPEVNARGTVDVYINRMFIGAGNRDVLPPWAKFLQGVVECNELTPNAARDNVVRDAVLAAAQQALGTLIVGELTELSRTRHSRFVEIMRWHAYHILAMAVQAEHEEFFRAVADLMPLESDQGPITIADYLTTAPERDDGSRVVYYIIERGSANQYYLLAGARGIRVLNCAEPFAERFLQKYAQAWPQRVYLRRLDVAGSDTIFEPLTAEEAARFAELESACGQIFPERRFVARVTRFEPAELPAVLTETREGKNRREMADVAGDLGLPQFLRDLVQDFLAEDSDPLTLYLNATNSAIQRLASRADLRDEVSRQALISLYNNALMLLSRTLPAKTIQTMFTQYNQVIELMLSLADERAQLERTIFARQLELDGLAAEADPAGDRTARGTVADGGGDAGGAELDPYVSCFVAAAGDARAAEIYDAVRAVLEDKPYYWRVLRAEGSQGEPARWPDARELLLRAHLHVAVLTGDAPPGVLIDVGRMQALGRPLLLLRDAGAAALPAELDGPAAELRATGDQLRAEVAAAMDREPAVQALRKRDRFLSPEVLTREASVSKQAGGQISRYYPAWRGFLHADSAEVARQAGLSRHLVDAVKETLRSLYAGET
jgi:hypothetical protein